MKRMLPLSLVVWLVMGCAGMSDSRGGDTELATPGAVDAASMGYHGPLHRMRNLYGN